MISGKNAGLHAKSGTVGRSEFVTTAHIIVIVICGCVKCDCYWPYSWSTYSPGPADRWTVAIDGNTERSRHSRHSDYREEDRRSASYALGRGHWACQLAYTPRCAVLWVSWGGRSIPSPCLFCSRPIARITQDHRQSYNRVVCSR